MTLENANNLIEGTQFQLDLEQTFSFNGKPMTRAFYNLVVSIRDCSMWANMNMKPHRNWRISDVKKYFGIKGNAQKVLEQLEGIKEFM